MFNSKLFLKVIAVRSSTWLDIIADNGIGVLRMSHGVFNFNLLVTYFDFHSLSWDFSSVCKRALSYFLVEDVLYTHTLEI